MANVDPLKTWSIGDKVLFFLGVCFCAYPVVFLKLELYKIPVPNVELASMGFTVFNITETRLSAKWDLSVRIHYYIPPTYICPQGDFQASFLYKNVTLVTSTLQTYHNLQYDHPQVLDVVFEKEIGGLIGQEIMEDIREKKQVNFGLRFFIMPDCGRRDGTTATMSYACNEAVFRFEPGSEMQATVFGNHTSCINF